MGTVGYQALIGVAVLALMVALIVVLWAIVSTTRGEDARKRQDFMRRYPDPDTARAVYDRNVEAYYAQRRRAWEAEFGSAAMEAKRRAAHGTAAAQGRSGVV